MPPMATDVLFAYYGVVESNAALSATVELAPDVPESLWRIGGRVHALARKYHCGARRGYVLGSTVTLGLPRIMSCLRIWTFEEGYSDSDNDWPDKPTTLKHEAQLLEWLRSSLFAGLQEASSFRPPTIDIADPEKRLRLAEWTNVATKLARARVNWALTIVADIDLMLSVLPEVVNAR